MRATFNRNDFYRGDKVEVSIKEDGFLGSYYEATVVSYLGNDLYVVEYKNLLEDDESKPLTETVYANEVRPVPPRIPASGFALHQKVDAFDNDGWWIGFITRKKGSDYYVYFETTNQEISYPLSQLRVHQDWVLGKWVSPKKSRSRFKSPTSSGPLVP